MKLSLAKFYPANAANFTRGREGNAAKFVTIHHSAGWEATLRYLWADPNRRGSSHFWVGNLPGQIEQYVDTDDTAWTNGNWRSNLQSITIEIRGDWRGYHNQQTLDNLDLLLREIRKNYPSVSIEYHKDVSDKITLCPADLKDKGYARQVWDKVTAWLKPKPTPPPAAAIEYSPITPKRIRLLRDTNLWDFNFTNWNDAKSVKPFYKGDLIDVVAIAKNKLGGKYYMTAYSYNGGNVRATTGFNIVDCEDYVPAVTEPPTVEEKWEPMATPRKMRLLYDNRVTDLTTRQLVGDVIRAGTDVDLQDKKTVREGTNTRVYVRSKWAHDADKNWGIPLDQFTEVPSTQPEPPREPVPEPPIDVNPDIPGRGDPQEPIDPNVPPAKKNLLQLLLQFLRVVRTIFTRKKD